LTLTEYQIALASLCNKSFCYGQYSPIEAHQYRNGNYVWLKS